MSDLKPMREAHKYTKKPVTIDAFQLGHDTPPKWFEDAANTGDAEIHQDGSAAIYTLEGTMNADLGDWIIRGVKGEIYPCQPDIFGATYTRATPPPSGDVERVVAMVMDLTLGNANIETVRARVKAGHANKHLSALPVPALSEDEAVHRLAIIIRDFLRRQIDSWNYADGAFDHGDYSITIGENDFDAAELARALVAAGAIKTSSEETV